MDQFIDWQLTGRKCRHHWHGQGCGHYETKTLRHKTDRKDWEELIKKCVFAPCVDSLHVESCWPLAGRSIGQLEARMGLSSVEAPVGFEAGVARPLQRKQWAGSQGRSCGACGDAAQWVAWCTFCGPTSEKCYPDITKWCQSLKVTWQCEMTWQFVANWFIVTSSERQCEVNNVLRFVWSEQQPMA